MFQLFPEPFEKYFDGFGKNLILFPDNIQFRFQFLFKRTKYQLALTGRIHLPIKTNGAAAPESTRIPAL